MGRLAFTQLVIGRSAYCRGLLGNGPVIDDITAPRRPSRGFHSSVSEWHWKGHGQRWTSTSSLVVCKERLPNVGHCSAGTRVRTTGLGCSWTPSLNLTQFHKFASTSAASRLPWSRSLVRESNLRQPVCANTSRSDSLIGCRITMESPMCTHTLIDSEPEMANGVSSEDGPNPSDFLLPYEPTDWMKVLKNIPKYRVKLIHGVTPIQRWYLPDVPGDFEIHIKRDDMTGSELSGNKARKLEFLLADAIQQGCTSVITCGSMQSNHCRATAIATRQMGLEPYLLLRSPVSDPAEVTCSGNMLLNRLIGAHVHLMPKKAQFATDIKPRLDQLVQKIKEETGGSAYPVGIGGSSAVGLFGYLQGFCELQQQGVLEEFTDIVIACGSNGSTLGLALANYLTGSRLKVHGMIVSDDSKFHFDGMNKVLREVDVKDSSGKALQAEDIVNLVEGVKGKGYGLSTQAELDLVAKVCAKTGIIIDAVYTGKSVLHLLRLARDKPDMFKGNKILFVHTGGIFGMFDGRMDETLQRNGLKQNKIQEWMELGDQAPDLNL